MKMLGIKLMSLLFFLSGCITVYSQADQREVPGDHFSLEGALELFKKSKSPEEFEQLLNSADSKVNNLDLNGDGYTDYIKVIDKNEGNVHAFILQAIVSEAESQDIAVIELGKSYDGKATLQITGDEDIYGIETIIEPTEEVRVNAGASTMRTIVNVWTWPSVRYVYSPYYSGWVSPWRWSMRPVWWSAWRPVAYYEYNPWWQPYRPYYSVCHTHRIVNAQRIYRPCRTTSVVVYHRHNTQIKHYRSNHDSYYHNGPQRHNDSRSRSDYGRNRYDNNDNNYNGRQTNAYRNDNNGRSWSGTNQQGNSRPSTNNSRSQRHDKEDFTFKSPSKRDEFIENRSASDYRSTSNGSQRDFFSQQRENLERKERLASTNNIVSQQQVIRPIAPVNRREFSASPSVQRPANGEGLRKIESSRNGQFIRSNQH